MTTPTKPSAAFWIVSALALVWNLMGAIAFIMNVAMTPEMLAALPAEQQQLLTSTPMWAMIAFAFAVFGSTLGCILLLMKRRLAVPILSIAFAGILVQMVYTVVISKSIEVYGLGHMTMPVMILLIGGFLIWYSRKAAAMGWLR